MSNQINDGGPAFPVSVEAWDRGQHLGMSLRDYFAAAETLDDLEDLNMGCAIALAGPKPAGDWCSNPIEWLKWDARWRAEVRFIRADAMLKAREAKP